jgi:ATP adenylyltransferase
MEYIANADRVEGCIFCTKSMESNDAENFLLCRGKNVFLMLNAFPYSNGHLMAAPYQHTANLDDLNDEAIMEWMLMTRKAVNLLKEAYNPDGFNVGVNMGRTAGAGIADHIHMHIVPRWNGDTNFMPVLGEVRVIPESLESVYGRLTNLLNK